MRAIVAARGARLALQPLLPSATGKASARPRIACLTRHQQSCERSHGAAPPTHRLHATSEEFAISWRSLPPERRAAPTVTRQRRGVKTVTRLQQAVKQKAVIQGFPRPDHDHAQCVEQALERAEAVCRERGERFTVLRRLVFELVWNSHRPIKAYDLLELVLRHGRRGSPPTVYRALEFLQSAGLVHKIESLNAFVGCADPERPHSGQFLICDQCGIVAELEDAAIASRLDADAKRIGFNLATVRVEATGRCKGCRTSSTAGTAGGS